METFVPLLFSTSALPVIPFWLLMTLAPRWRWTERLVAGPAIFAGLAGPVLVYAALVLPSVGTLAPAVARPELATIASLLGTPLGATIAWMHFLALDLFAGRWIYLDARQRGLSSWVVSPVLVATLLFAPLGLAAYAVALLARRAPVRAAVRGLLAAHRPLTLVALGCLPLLAAALVLQTLDPREVVGASTWLKPAKFAASIALAGVSLAWIIGQMSTDARASRLHRAGTIMAVVAAFELIVITIQAARGVPSHFNAATPLDGAIFTAMGIAITIFWLAELYVAVRAFRHGFASPARAWAIRLGLIGTLAGGAVGYLMSTPSRAQVSELQAGARPALMGSHTVGAPDGGAGMPVTRWSTEAGDLRVSHFLGLHALQGLPLFAVWLERRRRRAARPVAALGLAWVGLTAVTLVQALRGQPLLAPDAVTLGSAALVLAGALAVWLAPVGVVYSGRSARPRAVSTG
jgi:hypothetical protein